jgi:hypothetical protein
MIDLLYNNSILTLEEIDYEISSIDLISDEIVYLNIYNDNYNYTYAVVANETVINKVLQTSAQMIIDTLSSQNEFN